MRMLGSARLLIRTPRHIAGLPPQNSASHTVRLMLAYNTRRMLLMLFASATIVKTYAHRIPRRRTSSDAREDLQMSFILKRRSLFTRTTTHAFNVRSRAMQISRPMRAALLLASLACRRRHGEEAREQILFILTLDGQYIFH